MAQRQNSVCSLERSCAVRGRFRIRMSTSHRLTPCVVAAALLLTVSLLSSGCAKAVATDARRGGMDANVPVSVATAAQEDVPVQLHAIARVEAYQTVTVKPQVAGQLVSIHFTEGQDVKAGDLLYSIDPRPFQAALDQAEANLAKNTALANDAEVEAEWAADMVKQNAAAKREYERAKATAESLHAAVRADVAEVDKARLNLEYCAIRSPLDGRTGSRLADVGNVVKENETALVVINQLSPIYVTFAVPEQYLADINQYQTTGQLFVTAVVDPNATITERGELTFIDNAVDRTTGMITLKGTFPNDDRRLWPGLFVNAFLTLTTLSDAVVVPSQAVQTGQAGPYVFVVKADSTVESRPVATGPAVGERVVVTSGVQVGDTVVTDGQLRLTPGARVVVKDGKPTTQEARP